MDMPTVPRKTPKTPFSLRLDPEAVDGIQARPPALDERHGWKGFAAGRTELEARHGR
jgi:hypothetical protein